jgi:hypothetical protein
MRKRLKTLALSAIIVANLMIFSGCDSLFKKTPEVQPEPKIETPITSPDEDNKVKEMLKEYFGKIYEKPINEYEQNILSGNIPDSISGMIANRTLEEGNNNPEVGIHLPRMVSINGIVALDYDIIIANDGKPLVDAAFVGDTNDIFVYYVKVDLKAKGLAESYFLQYYQKNPDTKLYERIKENGQEKEINEEAYDYIKVQARYDVIKEVKDYKVLTQREANYKPGLTKRLFILNNDFLTRIPYLNTKIEEEKKVYDEEKALIELYFNNLLKVDKERMNLIKSNWNKDKLVFIDILQKIGVSSAEGGKNLLLIDDDYKGKFKIESFPLQINMERLNRYDSFTVSVHPGYSYKNKMYMVSFKAAAVNTNGMIGDETFYQYDYVITMKNVNGTTLIDSVKLNEYFKTTAPAQKTEAKDEKKSDSKDTESKN